MRRFMLLLLTTALSALLASPLAAQACVGLPSFDGRPIRLSFAAEFPDSAKAYAAGLGVGKAGGLFGGVGAGQVSFEGFEEKATLGFVELGFEVGLGPVRVCPILGGSYGVGPNEEALALEVSSRAGAAGGAIGVPLSAGPLILIPNLSVRYEHLSQRVEADGFDPVTDRFESTVLDLGVGVVLGGFLGLQPLVHVPLDEGSEEPVSYGVVASLGFGLP